MARFALLALIATCYIILPAQCLSVVPNLSMFPVGRELLVPQNCTKDKDCKEKWCTCLTGANVCSNSGAYSAFLQSCRNCTTDADCKLTGGNDPNDPDKCSNTTGRCQRCSIDASHQGIKHCTNITAAVDPLPTGPPENATAPCVATAWLKKRGLQQYALRYDVGMASVLCLPRKGQEEELPCGTPGHLLLKDGYLVSYRDLCDSKHLDCTETTLSVSQLRHDVEWSKYKDTDRGLQLTSLSAHALSTQYSPSRVVARVAHLLNRNGLGLFCNAVSTFPYRLQIALDKFSSLSASSS